MTNSKFAMKIYHILNESDALSLDMFSLIGFHPTLVLSGRTSLWAEKAYPVSLWPFFTALASAIISVDLHTRPVVLTGATQCGIIQMFGQACENIGYYPKALIGIAPQYFIEEMQVRLEEHHSHILLTPGRQWDEAIPVMRRVRKAIAREKQAVMLVVGGGEETLKEMLAHANDHVPVYVLSDGGRLSKGFSSRTEANHSSYSLHQQIQATNLVRLLELSQPEKAIGELMQALGYGKGKGDGYEYSVSCTGT